MEQRKLAALWSIAAMLVVIAVLFVVLIAVICCKGKRRNFGGMSKDEIILQALALMLKERGVDMSRI
jgi:membrane protein YdbS with pleckstrin-like domain